MIETIHEWTENPIYCHKLQQVLNANNYHLRTHCTECPYFHGSAQGQGTECWYYDGTDDGITRNMSAVVLEQRMHAVDPALVQQMVDTRAERARAARLSAAIKALTSTKYKVKDKNGRYLGRITFAPDVALDLHSNDLALITIIQGMIMNPVNGVTVGAPGYPQAVVDELSALGFQVQQL